MSSFRSSCEAVLRHNDRGGYTVPSPRLYPHQWAWDSAFCAIGWAHIDARRALVELETLMAAQWDDGRVPHVVFHVPGEYFPGPELWETERSSSITQPPLWATAARRIAELHGIDGVAGMLPAFDASHRFFHTARDPLGWGVVCVVHPWESGLDNAPVWDAPLARVDVSNPPSFRRRDIHVVSDASMRPTDEQYMRYAVLVKQIAASGFGAGSFAVYDPFMTACLARAETDLAWLAERAGWPCDAATRAARLTRALIDRLWDDAHGRCIYIDARTGERLTADVIGGYAPLWAGCDAAIAARLVRGLRDRFRTCWPLASTAPADPCYEPRRYWRGPTWVNINWMLAEALGPELASLTLDLVRQSGFYEYFHPETGEPLGADSFAWTAALALDLHSR